MDTPNQRVGGSGKDHSKRGISTNQYDGMVESSESAGLPPPPLPPRPEVFGTADIGSIAPMSSIKLPTRNSRPQLQSKATTAVSLTDIHTQSYPDGYRETRELRDISSSTGVHSASASVSEQSHASEHRSGRRRVSTENDDNASIRSYVPTLEVGGDVESLLGDVVESGTSSTAWKLLNSQSEGVIPFEQFDQREQELEVAFQHEFDDMPEPAPNGSNEEALLNLWKSKLKHFLILSSAGKPIYTRHGDENLISGYIGIIQTIISFYENSTDPIRSFVAGGVEFVVLIEGPLYLVAISRLNENSAQLRTQLQALYMQILSTLTLPNLTHLFTNRPSTDLRRPLQGTEPLLSALADSFTRGSPSTLLSALECLKLRKSQRNIVNNVLLKSKTENLLYGLIVAGGRLVSVVRPKKHSLHPSDLQLIFNMLFDAGGVKAAGGENWIPLCLPSFNNRGYLYMYVSFLSAQEGEGDIQERPSSAGRKEDEVAVVLISANKDSFFELKQMREEVVEQLDRNGSMEIIKASVRRGRPSTVDILPGTVLRHFLYKSRSNVQFAMPSYDPYFESAFSKRKLLSLYHTLHASAHGKNAHLKVHHCVSREFISLAWVTPLFELYCVAGPNVTRNALAQGANKIVQWARREEERVFIIGGAVF